MQRKRFDSQERRESMKEVNYGKSLISDSCPIRIEMDHLPDIDRVRKMSASGKSYTRPQSMANLSLPALYGQEGSYFHLQHFHLNQEEMEELEKDTKGTFDYVGPSACVTKFDLLPEDEVPVAPKRTDEKVEESNALKRWQYWTKDKQRMQEYLSKRLHKSPCRLLLQESDKYRRWLEDRWLSTCTRIPEADKWRGHPFRWKAEVRLPNRKIRWNQSKSGSPPDYCAVKTSIDKGEIPAMEFIGIPRTIQKEKGLICEKDSFDNSMDIDFLGAEEAQYFFRRRKKLKPHEINMDELEVIGHKIVEAKEICKEKSEIREFPEINIQGPDDGSKSQGRVVHTSVFWLIIGGKQIKYEVKTDYCQVPTKVQTWQINFGLNTVGTLVEKVLKVENRGTIAVRYSWISRTPPASLNLEKLQPKHYEPWFFFNKNSGFFLPGQVYNLKFYHKSTFSGIRKEVWYLKTEPPLSQRTNLSVVTISAVVTEDIYGGIHPLERYLDGRVRDTIIHCILEIILNKAFRPHRVGGIEYRSLFSKRILFEHNNPNLYYNSKIVRELNQIYLETEPHPPDWDLSLDTLIRRVNAKKTSKERNATLVQITKKAEMLLKPTYTTVRSNRKYCMAYEILCRMANCMEDDYFYCRNSLSERGGGLGYRKSYFENGESSPYTSREDMGEFDGYFGDFWEIRPVNFLFFKTVLYIKVYNRLCEAADHIAAILETEKLFEPWQQVSYTIRKPASRRSERDISSATI